jgi:hypothetical protein
MIYLVIPPRPSFAKHHAHVVATAPRVVRSQAIQRIARISEVWPPVKLSPRYKVLMHIRNTPTRILYAPPPAGSQPTRQGFRSPGMRKKPTKLRTD